MFVFSPSAQSHALTRDPPQTKNKPTTQKNVHTTRVNELENKPTTTTNNNGRLHVFRNKTYSIGVYICVSYIMRSRTTVDKKMTHKILKGTTWISPLSKGRFGDCPKRQQRGQQTKKKPLIHPQDDDDNYDDDKWWELSKKGEVDYGTKTSSLDARGMGNRDILIAPKKTTLSPKVFCFYIFHSLVLWRRILSYIRTSLLFLLLSSSSSSSSLWLIRLSSKLITNTLNQFDCFDSFSKILHKDCPVLIHNIRSIQPITWQ